MITAIVLAGGLGTRLRSEVQDVPKPMAPILGRPFLAYLLDYWIGQGVGRFVLSVGYMSEVVIDYFGSSYRDVKIDYAIEDSPRGTGGALLLARQLIDSKIPFLLLNGDTYFAANLRELIEYSDESRANWTFALFRTSQEGRYMGLEIAKNGQILALKSGASGGERLANGGVYWVSADALLYANGGQKVSLEHDIFPAAMSSGQRLFGKEVKGAFIDIGVPEDYRRASSVIGL
jgi:D-glycero-alpha-D-manno-heptose 1-phosphate guanylyltransferase